MNWAWWVLFWMTAFCGVLVVVTGLAAWSIVLFIGGIGFCGLALSNLNPRNTR